MTATAAAARPQPPPTPLTLVALREQLTERVVSDAVMKLGRGPADQQARRARAWRRSLASLQGLTGDLLLLLIATRCSMDEAALACACTPAMARRTVLAGMTTLGTLGRGYGPN